MTNQGKPAPHKQQRIVLPFEKRQKDLGSWTYEHKVGLCVMIIAYLLIGIAFMSAKIIINRPSSSHTIYIEMEEPMPRPEEQQTPEERRESEEQLRDVRNRVSNENASTETTPEKARGAMTQELSEAAEEIAQKLQASREAYEQGLREEQQMLEEMRARNSKAGSEGKDDKQQDVKIKGNVIISFSLEGRSAVFLFKPAYQCEGGGEVVVDIVVNRNGKVTKASIRDTSTDSECINERAVEAALKSRFNADGSAPDRQSGTITYLFVPQ